DRYELQWQYFDASKVEIDPEPDPKPNLRNTPGKITINPKTATTYTMTVTGGLGGKLVRTCTVNLKPTRCMLDAPPEVDKTSKTFPIKWSVENAKTATMQTIVNGKPAGDPVPLDVDDGDTSATIDQPTPKESTEYVITVTGPGGAKSTCRACVTIRAGKGKTLPIQPATQQKDMWCWLTVGEMVFTYYKVRNLNPNGFYQCGIIGVLLPHLCGLDCTKCAALGGGMGMRQFITDMLKKYPPAANSPPINSDFVIKKRPLTAQQVKDEIDANRPVIAGISTSGQLKYPPEHVALIVGYEEVDGKLRLRVNDPYPFGINDPYLKAGAQKNCGGSYYIDYETFCNKMAWDAAWWHIQPGK
ncbi:MAG: C39 family peptidase, partial [Bryobacteraceae bacterium]